MSHRETAKKEVGGGALGPDTTGAATRDCTAAMHARARELTARAPKPAGLRNWRTQTGQGVRTDLRHKYQAHLQEEADQ